MNRYDPEAAAVKLLEHMSVRNIAAAETRWGFVWQAEVSFDGNPVAVATDDGHGGPVEFTAVSDPARPILRDLLRAGDIVLRRPEGLSLIVAKLADMADVTGGQ